MPHVLPFDVSPLIRDGTVVPFGELQQEIMDVFWDAPGSLTVSDVHQALDKRLAYATVLQTVDRLYSKGLLIRSQDANAPVSKVNRPVYTPSIGRDEFRAWIVRHTLDALRAYAPELTERWDG